MIFAVLAGLFAVLGGVTIGAAATDSWVLAIVGFFVWLFTFFAVAIAYFPFFGGRAGRPPACACSTCAWCATGTAAR